ncbi:hypothetical protein WH52_14090 [Tenacibaculum holothuriorum]|uniref:Uncharacterized protein n=1 Tax=Tenacibaculum holothuriorum TaxID=1635173 RepID=A0A1Y2P9Q4_9FLAO|nr:hypothetical protein [Tenacibaculum holothuriorum]OSY86910.1 hypothetical protein WH52_14090 [Tenacibaculum holothuriorum]
MKSKIIFLSCILTFAFSFNVINAQTVKKAKLKYGGYGQKKFKEAEKKIFIEQFSINYQYIYAKSKVKKGGRQLGGESYIGDAKAALFLGLGDIEPSKLQELTDKAYEGFITQLKNKGYEILTGKDFKDHEYYKKSETYIGGTPSQQYKGFITTNPTNITFIGKNYGMFNTTLKTSKSLGGVIVARVNILVPFAEDGESQGSRAFGKLIGGIAKVVAKPNLRLAKSASIQSKSKLGFNKSTLIMSSFDFGFKKNLKYQAWFTSTLPKKGIPVAGVLPNKKYKAVKTGKVDMQGDHIGNGYKVFNVPTREAKVIQTIKFDSTKYFNGVLEGVNYYLGESTNKYFSKI